MLVGLQGKSIQPVTLLKVKVKSAYEQVTNQASACLQFLEKEATRSVIERCLSIAGLPTALNSLVPIY